MSLNLSWSPTFSRQILTNSVSGEECLLEGEEPWKLHSEHTPPFLSTATGETIWCSSKLAVQVAQHPKVENVWLAFPKGGALQNFWKWRQDFLTLHSQPLTLQTFALKCHWHGALILLEPEPSL